MPGKGDPTSPIELPEERSVLRNQVLYTIPKFGKTYNVKFQLYPVEFRQGETNILHLTSGDRNCCNHGNRIPFVSLESSGNQATSAKLKICSSVNWQVGSEVK